MLYNREAVLAWGFLEIGKVKKEVSYPLKIWTVDHNACQVPGFSITKDLTFTVIDMLPEKLKIEVIELCDGPYWNPWYLIKKVSPRKSWIVNVAVKFNWVITWDANQSLFPDEFFEKFAGCTISFLIHFFSGYDQVELAKESWDLTAFMTPPRIMRKTTLAQGATNSIAKFWRILLKILAPQLRDWAKSFLDDVRLKKPKKILNTRN